MFESASVVYAKLDPLDCFLSSNFQRIYSLTRLCRRCSVSILTPLEYKIDHETTPAYITTAKSPSVIVPTGKDYIVFIGEAKKNVILVDS